MGTPVRQAEIGVLGPSSAGMCMGVLSPPENLEIVYEKSGNI